MKLIMPLLLLACLSFTGCATTGSSNDVFPTKDTTFQPTPRHSGMSVSSKMISPITSY